MHKRKACSYMEYIITEINIFHMRFWTRVRCHTPSHWQINLNISVFVFFPALIEVEFSRAAFAAGLWCVFKPAGGRWRQAATSVTASCSHYWCDYIRWNPPRGADTAGTQAVRGWDFCQHPFHLSPPSSSSASSSSSLCYTPPTPFSHPHPLRLWHRCLDSHFGSKRGLTKVSMATVQSVNHAAADVSSPSLFPFFSPPNLLLVHNPSHFSPLLPSLRLLLLLLSFPLRNLKTLHPWSTLSPLTHFFTLHSVTFPSPFSLSLSLSFLALML